MNYGKDRLSRLPSAQGLTAILLILLAGCADSRDTLPRVGEPTRLNHLQYLGTHNSYHIEPRSDLFEALLAFIPDGAPTLQYTHLPLGEQFEGQGIRQIELDIFQDPVGGLYASRKVLSIFNEDPASGIAELAQTQKGPPCRVSPVTFRSLAMTYSHMGRPHTTIGDVPFHY